MLRLENITYSVPQANGEREKILDDITDRKSTRLNSSH